MEKRYRAEARSVRDRIESGQEQAVGFLLPHACPLVIEVDRLQTVDQVHHVDILVSYRLNDIDHGRGQAAGFVDDEVPVRILFGQSGHWIDFRKPDAVGDAALDARRVGLGQAVIPVGFAAPGGLHGVEADAQVLDDIGQQGHGVNLEAGDIDQNAPPDGPAGPRDRSGHRR